MGFIIIACANLCGQVYRTNCSLSVAGKNVKQCNNLENSLEISYEVKNTHNILPINTNLPKRNKNLISTKKMHVLNS